MQIYKICTCEYIFENNTHKHIFYLSTHWILSSLRVGFCCVFLYISQHIDTQQTSFAYINVNIKASTMISNRLPPCWTS